MILFRSMAALLSVDISLWPRHDDEIADASCRLDVCNDGMPRAARAVAAIAEGCLHHPPAETAIGKGGASVAVVPASPDSE